MKVKYETTIKISVTHDVDTLEGLKNDREFATDICEMICDECTYINAIASYDIIESSIDIQGNEEKPINEFLSKRFMNVI